MNPDPCFKPGHVAIFSDDKIRTSLILECLKQMITGKVHVVLVSENRKPYQTWLDKHALSVRHHRTVDELQHAWPRYFEEQEVKFQHTSFDQKEQISRMIFVFDACLEPPFTFSRLFSHLFRNGACLRMSAIVHDTLPKFPSDISANLHYILLEPTDDRRTRQKFFVHFAGMLPCVQEFNRLFEEITRDDGIVLIDQTKPKGEIRRF